MSKQDTALTETEPQQVCKQSNMGTTEEDILECPVCQDLFTDPVTLSCGHHFCLTCIRNVWDADVSDAGPFFCPECQIILPSRPALEINTSLQAKVKDFTGVNRPDATMRQKTSPICCDHCIEDKAVAVRTCLTCDASLCQAHALLHQERAALREHTLVDVIEDPMSLKCREHREELKLFCEEERLPVCCLCALVGVHKSHQTVQLHEACSDFKGMLESTMNQLLRRRSEAEDFIKDLESLYAETLKSTADFRERISEKYSRIRFVLDGDERLMMQVIDAEETYMTAWLDAQRAIMEGRLREINNLRAASKSLLQETNDLKFLQQITAHSLGRPLDLAPIQEVDRDLCDPERLRTVERLIDDFSMALAQHLPRMWSYLSTLSLDSKTAHPKLEVSQDRKQVQWTRQPLGEAPSSQPYDSQYSVLAEESFTTGKHYWEVIVQEKPYWLLGMSTGPLPNNDGPTVNISGPETNKTSWYVYHGDGQYLACHDAQEEQLSATGGKRLRKLGMFADLQKGELSFYNADTLTVIHCFAVGCKEPLYPVFNPCIDASGLNRQPLVLLCLRDCD